MLDRKHPDQYNYYQPGFGTYTSSTWLTHHGETNKLKSAYLKAKDSAIGSSFQQHVLAGYEFLIRHYTCGDRIYLFGFSRGAYVARFLAEMIDHVGVLEPGNEELARFAWKAFAKWQKLRNLKDVDECEQDKVYEFLQSFRETFTRPITQISFLGLFDTINSVPTLENTFMRRKRFPFAAHTTAKTIRHAVSIDERRSKFRHVLISRTKPTAPSHRFRLRQRLDRHHVHLPRQRGIHLRWPERVPSTPIGAQEDRETIKQPYRSTTQPERHIVNCRNRSTQTHTEPCDASNVSDDSRETGTSEAQTSERVGRCNGDNAEQDIKEVWFAGSHADIGGGWNFDKNEYCVLSHIPLVWMVQEAQSAGLRFDLEKLKQFNCYDNAEDSDRIPLSETCTGAYHSPNTKSRGGNIDPGTTFTSALLEASTHAPIHDCLQHGKGLPLGLVFCWRLAEYAPFRRMAMVDDGDWKPIRWPPPAGEARDIPEDAEIHNSVIRRMKADDKYLPSNLMKLARRNGQTEGIGGWEIAGHTGSLVRETYRCARPERTPDNANY